MSFLRRLYSTKSNTAQAMVEQEEPLTREAKILHMVNPSRPGIEIGPSHRPIAPKSKGFHVTIIDHLDKAGLVSKYAHHGVDVNAIEDVDLVWRGESYLALTGKPMFYDWIIACHLIEHTPDLIGFIKSCEDVLSPNGVLSLAIPDKRYCFDKFRNKTGLASIIDAHLSKRTIHSAGTAAEYFLNVVSRDRSIAWNHTDTGGDFNFVHTKDDAANGMARIINDQAYLDLHAWVFTPCSFRLLIQDLNALNLITLREDCYFDTVGHEFFITLSRNGKGPGVSRMELAAMANREV